MDERVKLLEELLQKLNIWVTAAIKKMDILLEKPKYDYDAQQKVIFYDGEISAWDKTIKFIKKKRDVLY